MSIFHRLQDMWYQNRVHAGADWRSRLSSMRPDLEEICKNTEHCFFFSVNFCKVISHKNMLSVLICVTVIR